ncbi:MAG: DEAD/DEAH box helicase [Carnobacterium sp.]|uniref:ATP-dependent RNA helicase DbpA n=1 Tax=Carnobacterium antarcticum TaxID=2126436 RepID=A0ABW4NK68_9LACT|nr:MULTISPECIES: DEAD/DEAH box helicase [unclassified Carnobacterium]ALV21949.1 ATP-dependent RNA helicase YxiN [Carnobacterium sp. CP1]QQP69922.1 DEAD/DEAH box helicase [Carnobacterium sp. CS13]
MKKNTFEEFGIGEELVTALESLRYFKPTKVQEEVLPLALAEKDVIVESQTGSGKTVSFGIPLCENVIWEENRPQALVLVPTRELALQVKEDITNIGRLKRIKVTSVFGKASFDKQKSELKQKSHIVVGTPGRVLDHLQKGTMKVDKLRYLVIDEADEMLNMGFIDQMAAIIEFLPEERQTLLFSATMPPEIERLASFYMKPDRAAIKIEMTEQSRPKIVQSYLKVEPEKKEQQLLDLLIVENPDSCMIFCNTQEAVNRLYTFLNKAGLPIDKIHGGMVQEDRFDVMDDFRKGKFRYLVATDVAARGIDIDNVTHVINYDVPVEKESFVHRTGRTGRAGKTGVALTLVTPKERPWWQEVRAYVQQEISEITAPNARVVQSHKSAFEKKLQERLVVKRARNKELNQGITKIYFNGGKKKKLRAVDFVGTLTNIPGIKADDIGIITIQENVTYVEVLNGKGPRVIEEMKDRTVKGKQLKVYKANK